MKVTTASVLPVENSPLQTHVGSDLPFNAELVEVKVEEHLEAFERTEL